MMIFEPEESPFKVVYIDITHRCQMACANCYLPNRTVPDMQVEALYKCLERLKLKTDLRLIGGEPTLRDDLDQIIQKIILLGHRPILVTNGLKLADLNYAQSLRDSGLRYVQLSFNGYKYDDIYSKIDKMKCGDLKMQALENCLKVGLKVSLSCILVRNLNLHLVDELIDFTESLPKPSRINFRNVGDIGRNMTSQVASLSMMEMCELVASKLKIPVTELLKSKTAENQIRYFSKKGQRYSQQVIIKLTDWTIFQEEQFFDPKAMVRGRITQDFKLAPHFEHVKENEFGY